MPMYAAHRADTPPGPAGRWMIERLKDTADRCPKPESDTPPVVALKAVNC
jgi:hypothetical protein